MERVAALERTNVTPGIAATATPAPTAATPLDQVALREPPKVRHPVYLRPSEGLAGQEARLRPKDPLEGTGLHQDAGRVGPAVRALRLQRGQQHLQLRLLQPLQDLLGLLEDVAAAAAAKLLL